LIHTAHNPCIPKDVGNILCGCDQIVMPKGSHSMSRNNMRMFSHIFFG